MGPPRPNLALFERAASSRVAATVSCNPNSLPSMKNRNGGLSPAQARPKPGNLNLGGFMSRLALALVPALALTPVLAPTLVSAQETPATEAPAASARESHSAMFARMQERIRNTPTSTILTTSIISSVGFGPELLWGAGLQMRLDHTPGGQALRAGGWLQSELMTDGGVRVAAGLHGGLWMMGLQVGMAYRTESDRYLSTLGVQLGKTIEFGMFQLGGRIVIPVLDFSPMSQNAALAPAGIEGAVYLTVGLPAVLEGEAPSCGCSHRREAEEPTEE